MRMLKFAVFQRAFVGMAVDPVQGPSPGETGGNDCRQAGKQ
jgi:hypothetical protein